MDDMKIEELDMTIEELDKELRRIKKKKERATRNGSIRDRRFQEQFIEEIKKTVEKFPQISVEEAEKEVRDKWPGYGEFIPRDWIDVLDILIEDHRPFIETTKRMNIAKLFDSELGPVFNEVREPEVYEKIVKHLSTLERAKAGNKTKKTKKKKPKTKKLKKATLKELIQIAKKHKMSYKGKTKKQIADSLSASRSSKLTKKEKLAIIPFCSSNKNKKLLLR